MTDYFQCRLARAKCCRLDIDNPKIREYPDGLEAGGQDVPRRLCKRRLRKIQIKTNSKTKLTYIPDDD